MYIGSLRYRQQNMDNEPVYFWCSWGPPDESLPDLLDEYMCICPHCGAVIKERGISDYYSDLNMLWCDDCGARSALKTPVKTDINVGEIYDGELDSKNDDEDEDYTPVVWEAHLHFIKKVVGVDIHKGKRIEDTKDPLWEKALPVDSDDIDNPAIEYPKETDLSHDGIYVYYTCEGDEDIHWYAGD